MKGKEKRNLEIQNLVLSGYTQERIADKLNISVSTVARAVKKMRNSSKQWLQNLAEKDYANIYREALEGFQQDLMNLNDMLEDPQVQKNVKLQLQIRKMIIDTRSKRLEHLLRGPVVWSMDALIKKCKPEPIEQPVMESLGGITGIVK